MSHPCLQSLTQLVETLCPLGFSEVLSTLNEKNKVVPLYLVWKVRGGLRIVLFSKVLHLTTVFQQFCRRLSFANIWNEKKPGSERGLIILGETHQSSLRNQTNTRNILYVTRFTFSFPLHELL